ncbi:MAG: SH3 domain-containing protein [Bdellovibrionales bacterium]|nr:SH3 domain-containing protein [Bdellovibrionales bacterium]
MNKPIFIILLNLVLSSPLFAKDYRVQPIEIPGKKNYKAIVVVAPLYARAQPSYSAKNVFTLELDDQVSIVAQSSGWYGVRILTPKGTVLSAWVDKSSVRVEADQFVPRRLRPTPFPSNIAGKDSKALETSKTSSLTGNNELSLLISPIFDVYRYGVNQNRIGMAYSYRIFPFLMLDIPASYSFGGGFNTIQGGAGISLHMIKSKSVSVFWRLAIMGERFYDDRRHFSGISADFGAGVKWMPVKHMALSWEPLSAEVLVLNDAGIPLSIRAQSLFRVITVW